MDLRAFGDVLGRQHHVLGLDDAAALGVSRSALGRHAARNGLDRPARGVIVGPGSLPTFERAVMVALKAVGGDRVAVGWEAAAYLWGMTTQMPDVIVLIVPWDRHAPDLSGLALVVGDGEDAVGVTAVVRRSRNLMSSEVTDLGAIRITTPARTIVDLACPRALLDLRMLVIDARQRRITTLDDIERVHRRLRRYPGRPKVTRVLADLDEEDCDSRLEWEARRAAAERGFAPHPTPFPFTCPDGVTIEIDLAFPDRWVAGECDGLGSRRDRAALAKHHRRQNQAVAAGWRPFLIDWTRLTRDPDGLFADLALLLAADPGRPPAQPADPRHVDPRFRGRRRR